MYVFDDSRALRRARRTRAALSAARRVAAAAPHADGERARRARTRRRRRSRSGSRAPRRRRRRSRSSTRTGPIVRHIAGTHDENGEEIPNVPNAAGYNRVAWALDRDPPTPWRRVAKWDQGPSNGPPVPSGDVHGADAPRRRDVRTAHPRAARRARCVTPRTSVAAIASRPRCTASSRRSTTRSTGSTTCACSSRPRSPRSRTRRSRSARAPSLAEAQRIESSISSQPVNDQDDDFLEDLLRERVLTFVGDLSPGAPTGARCTEGTALRRESAAAASRDIARSSRATCGR